MHGQLLAPDTRDVHLDMVCKGEPSDEDTLAYVRRKIVAAARVSQVPIRYGKVKITHEPHPSIARRDIVAVTLDVDGQPIRAHAAGYTTKEAVDILEERLRRELADLHHQLAFRRRQRRANTLPGEWRHGGIATARPTYFPRAPEEREVVRRKTYSLGRTTPEDAALEMEMLDHDFHLFIDSATGRDSVIRRVRDGRYEVARALRDNEETAELSEIGVGPPPQAMTLGDAVEHLNATDGPFVFFVDVETSRGAILYWRYDGHYGVITAKSELDDEKEELR
jgi:ribosome-associated translation inhibitor RaiA